MKMEDETTNPWATHRIRHHLNVIHKPDLGYQMRQIQNVANQYMAEYGNDTGNTCLLVVQLLVATCHLLVDDLMKASS